LAPEYNFQKLLVPKLIFVQN